MGDGYLVRGKLLPTAAVDRRLRFRKVVLVDGEVELCESSLQNSDEEDLSS